MTPEKFTYQVAKAVFEERLTSNQGIAQLVSDLQMNSGSAKMIVVQIFPKLLQGELFTRTLSVSYFDCFLGCIVDDFGSEGLKIALDALSKHIEYSNNRGDAKVKLKSVYLKYVNVLEVDNRGIDKDEIEQSEIVRYYQKSKTRSELINELRSSKEFDTERVSINHKTYTRNNKVVALIKLLRGFECQICGISIEKRDGSKYIEAAHIKPKHKGGAESAENIILLCPNHHKEFDLGNLHAVIFEEDRVRIELNGNSYILSLAIN